MNNPNQDASEHVSAGTGAHDTLRHNQPTKPNTEQFSSASDDYSSPTPMHAQASTSTQLHADTRPSLQEHAGTRIDEQGHVADTNINIPIGTNEPSEVITEGATDEPTPEPKEPSDDQQSEWIELDETVQLLKQKGIDRAVRTIQRYCQVGKLTCTLTPTEKGARYLVRRSSVFEFIDHHNSMLPDRGEQFNGAGFGNTSAKPIQNHSTQEPRSNTEDVSQTLAMKDQIIELKDQQLEQVLSQLAITNNQLEMKDDQIATMLERDKETHILLHNLQNMVGLPAASNPDSQQNKTYDVHPNQTSFEDRP